MSSRIEQPGEIIKISQLLFMKKRLVLVKWCR